MMDLKVLNSALEQLEDERGISKATLLEAIEQALAAAYKKDYGKKGQIVRARFDLDTGVTEFSQVKIVVDETLVRIPELDAEGNEIEVERDENDMRPRFNPEHHIMVADARKIKKDAVIDEEIVFPLESKEDYGRIAAQTAKQVIIQKLREAEKTSVLGEFQGKKGEIVSGTVQRIERGVVFLDLGRTVGILPPEEQIPTERYRQGARLRAYVYDVAEGQRGVSVRLSRSHPDMLRKLFDMEAPEIASGVVQIKSVAREPGSRSKIAVISSDKRIDPVGACVGQRGVRVNTVTQELGGEKIDIIEWNENPEEFVKASLSPATVLSIKINPEERKASVTVAPEEQSLAIGKGGQNVRLAARLTGWSIDIEGSTTQGTEEAKNEEPKEESEETTA